VVRPAATLLTGNVVVGSLDLWLKCCVQLPTRDSPRVSE